MQPAANLDRPTPQIITTLPTALVWQDILAQAVTGELIAAINYSSLAEICTDPEEVADALEHAENERGHADAFLREGKKIGVDVKANVDGQYWKRLRTAFLKCIAARDVVGCLIVQEVMLEAFAVASYERVGRVAPGTLGSTFAANAKEEGDHIDHAMSILRAERSIDAKRFDEKLYALHLEVITTLAEMMATNDKNGHCEVCHGDCVKQSLPTVGLTSGELRGASLQQYLTTLDMLGLPGEVTLEWVMQLPV